MTIVLSTPDYVVEHEPRHRLLTIARRADGQCLAFQGRRVAGQFRDCVRTHGSDYTLGRWIAWGRDAWTPLYKPGRAPL